MSNLYGCPRQSKQLTVKYLKKIKVWQSASTNTKIKKNIYISNIPRIYSNMSIKW